MSSINMTRTVDDHKSPQIIVFKSESAELTINAIENNQPGQADTLRLDLMVRPLRLKGIFGSREFSKVDFITLETDSWDYYLDQLTGGGDYMYIDLAKKLIYGANFSAKTEERYVALLYGIQRYKGLEPFLSHIGKPDPKFKDISLFKDDRTVKRDIIELEKLGINPVAIPSRTKISNGMLPNIRKLI